MELAQRKIETFADATQYLRSLDVQVPLDLEHRVCSLLRRGTLDSFSVAPGREIAATWLTLLNARGDDPLVWIVALLLFESSFDPKGPRWQEIDAALQEQQTLGGRTMRAIGTHFEVKRRLAARFYDFGRCGKISAANRSALQLAIDLFDELLAQDYNASRPNIRLKYYGMRGVAHLLLARGDEEPWRRSVLASADLEESRALGDTSAEHDQYLLEAYFKTHDGTGDEAILNRAHDIVRDARVRHATARGLLTLEGEVLLRRGIQLPKSPETAEEQMKWFVAALQSFEAALAAPPHQSFSDDYIRMKCGMARFRVYVARSRSGDDDRSLLDTAIGELDRSDANGFGDAGLSLPWALTMRAQGYATESRYDMAIGDLERASVMADALPETPAAQNLRAVVRARLAISRLNQSITAENADHIARVINEVLEFLEPDPKLIGPLARAGRALLRLGRGDAAIILRIVGFAGAASHDPSADAIALAYIAANAAGLLHILARDYGGDEHLSRAFTLFSDALTIGDQAPTEWWIFAGYVALKLGKNNLAAHNDGEAVHYLEDAVSWFSRAIEAANRENDTESPFRYREAYSKLGEACLRLHSVTLIDEQADAAISAMTESISLGNNTPQIYGLLADVYYRRGRAHGGIADLREALRLKSRAREIPPQTADEKSNWRENLSLSARIALRIFRVTYAVQNLADAVLFACKAAREDALWPWPLFQLADMTVAARNTSLRDALPDGAEEEELIRLVLDGNGDELNRRGCQLAIRNPSNLEQKILGGRQKVYVLRDEHRLLSESFVFKPTTEEGAKRELAAVAEFREFLAQKSAPHEFRLPTPLSTIPGDRPGAVTYVMRRSEGVQLGTYILRSMRVKDTASTDLINGAIAFLAHFHAWKARGGPRRQVGNGMDRVLANIGRVWQRTFDPDAARAAVAQLRGLMPSNVALLAKKDAHPENWLVTARQEIVMLDLEATTYLPLMFEVAQFLEDYPFFECSDEGWDRRQRVIDHYLLTLSHLAPEFPIPQLPVCLSAYEKYALIRATLGIGETRTSAPQASSVSSVLRAVTARRNHYLELAQYLARRGTDAPTRAVATFLKEAAVKRAEMTKPSAARMAESLPASDHWVW